ncbi:hypothetical protein [Caldisericum sp.]|uniref:hypothetical protein n=1 Tax=Caldisericum sp. TaxID=2499687 RepID=UPI003D150ACA
MPKYIKKTTIVDAFQAGNISDWGDLGNLASTDYIIRLADNSYHTMDESTFTSLYEPTIETATLIGTIDWD